MRICSELQREKKERKTLHVVLLIVSSSAKNGETNWSVETLKACLPIDIICRNIDEQFCSGHTPPVRMLIVSFLSHSVSFFSHWNAIDSPIDFYFEMINTPNRMYAFSVLVVCRSCHCWCCRLLSMCDVRINIITMALRTVQCTEHRAINGFAGIKQRTHICSNKSVFMMCAVGCQLSRFGRAASLVYIFLLLLRNFLHSSLLFVLRWINRSTR